MTGFEPLIYVWNTITIWHVIALVGITAFIGVLLPMRQRRPVIWSWLPFASASLASSYAMFALLFGQVFGDKYTVGMLWPSVVVIMLAFMVLPIADPSVFPSREKAVSRRLASFAVVFGALFFTFALWLLPRVVGFGLIDIPKLSWGVQL